MEIENFFVDGGRRKWLDGGQEPSKTHPLGFFINEKIKFLNLGVNNIQVPHKVRVRLRLAALALGPPPISDPS